MFCKALFPDNFLRQNIGAAGKKQDTVFKILSFKMIKTGILGNDEYRI
jgi:hypothetical protein